jgi:DNA replication protein DnaC
MLKKQIVTVILTPVNGYEFSDRATESKLQYEEYLALLLEQEFKRRQEASIKAKVGKAHFPYVKTVEEFDFSFQPALKEKEIIRLGSLEFIEKKENIIFLGPPGVGKTHLSIGLGIKACTAVVFFTAQKLIEELMIAKRENSIVGKILAYTRPHLLIIDELGYMPVSRDQANLLFQLISMRYEKVSIVLTSNYNFDNWGNIFDDNVVAAAIIDRLVHHAAIFYINFYINGASYRVKDKIKKAKASNN